MRHSKEVALYKGSCRNNWGRFILSGCSAAKTPTTHILLVRRNPTVSGGRVGFASFRKGTTDVGRAWNNKRAQAYAVVAR